MKGHNSVPAPPPWGDMIGYSRAVRVGSHIAVSQTSAMDEDGGISGDAYEQARAALHNVELALHALGGAIKDVLRTRIYLSDLSYLADVARAHSEVFRDTRPATSLIVGRLVTPDMLVEFDADAILIS